MLLRRITSALRKQDWVTVALEIMIVVIGIFFGSSGEWVEPITY